MQTQHGRRVAPDHENPGRGNETMHSIRIEHDIERMAVGCAFAIINRKGWHFERDNVDRCWDIETPAGWRTCFNAADLWSVIEEPGLA